MHIRLIQSGQRFMAGPDDKNFIATRKWDEQIERTSLDIETAFQKIARQVVFGTKGLDDGMLRSINNFYAILSERSKARYHEFNNEDEVILEQDMGRHTEAEIERLEAKGIFFGGPEQMNRVARGIAQRLALGVSQRNNPLWGVIRSNSFEFIVPDSYHLSASDVPPFLVAVGFRVRG